VVVSDRFRRHWDNYRAGAICLSCSLCCLILRDIKITAVNRLEEGVTALVEVAASFLTQARHW
jgi:hypothetical protein